MFSSLLLHLSRCTFPLQVWWVGCEPLLRLNQASMSTSTIWVAFSLASYQMKLWFIIQRMCPESSVIYFLCLCFVVTQEGGDYVRLQVSHSIWAKRNTCTAQHLQPLSYYSWCFRIALCSVKAMCHGSCITVVLPQLMCVHNVKHCIN